MNSAVSAKAGFGFVVLASLLFGTTGTAQQLAQVDASGLFIGAARQVIGGVALVLLVIFWGERNVFKLMLTKNGALAALGTLLYQITFFVGITNNGVSVGTVVALGSAPLFTAALSYLMLNERIRLNQALTFTIVAVGIWLLLVGFTLKINLSLGVISSLLAGAGYALYTVNAKAMVNAGINSTTALAVAFGGAVPIAAVILLFGQWRWLTELNGIGLALYLGLIPTALAYFFFGKGLISLSAATVATITLLEPVVATVLAVALVGESLRFVRWIGIVVVIAGLSRLGQLENRAGKLGAK